MPGRAGIKPAPRLDPPTYQVGAEFIPARKEQILRQPPALESLNSGYRFILFKQLILISIITQDRVPIDRLSLKHNRQEGP